MYSNKQLQAHCRIDRIEERPAELAPLIPGHVPRDGWQWLAAAQGTAAQAIEPIT